MLQSIMAVKSLVLQMLCHAHQWSEHTYNSKLYDSFCHNLPAECSIYKRDFTVLEQRVQSRCLSVWMCKIAYSIKIDGEHIGDGHKPKKWIAIFVENHRFVRNSLIHIHYMWQPWQCKSINLSDFRVVDSFTHFHAILTHTHTHHLQPSPVNQKL